MTTAQDLDRLLGEWLDEGPRRAPDRPLELALQHARTHPRRPDPLGFLRPDVMAPRRSAFGLRPVLVLAALALALAAAVSVGGGGNRDGVQPPVTSPSPTPIATPVASPSVAPTGRMIELDVAEGEPQTVTVNDASGTVVDVRSGNPESGTSFPSDAVVVTNADDATLQLGWSGFPCATDHTLAISADGTSMTLTRPECDGVTDAFGVDRILILEFSRPIDASAVSVTIAP